MPSPDRALATPLDESGHLQVLRDQVREFLDEEVIPAEPELAAGGPGARATLAALQEKARANGLWALPHPRELGGHGLRLAEYLYISEIEGRSAYGPVALGSDSLLDALMLQRHAGAETRERYLDPLVRGRMTPCFGMTEPGRSGSDPSLMITRARPVGDGWVIDGRKWFCRARDADFITVMCRTEPLGVPHAKAFTMFLVPLPSEGFSIVQPLTVLGAEDGHCEVAFDGVRVTAEQMIGGRGEGFPVSGERLSLGRTLRAMRWLGQAQRAFDLMCTRLHQREAFGGTLASKQLLQQHVFDAYTDIRSARSQVLRAAAMLDAGQDVYVEVATAKVLASNALYQVLDRAVQVYGAEGLSDRTPLAEMFRWARATRIYDGADELHTHMVAKRILKRYEQRGSYDFSAG
ncbi:acyl-CoA dehydrogenase family protein [Streptantibioticus ferralitis]|uniref:Acyl-CoA dehydrogenase family protein n=1 Tax=Streptantibioticus ferralitis TaxID=236510 RepID=A0ABT5YY33_9ACTN|nr:acyl-CoA dehydrogenase family protein [Streptantibioticus ferralitis]MDF2255735.1 acyl-CoA dehydrogenase family protein [Streptantibioticus ferralitis]